MPLNAIFSQVFELVACQAGSSLTTLLALGFDVVVNEFIRFGLAHMRKFIRVGWEKTEKLERDRLDMLGNAHRATPSRGLSRDPT
ncbi:hypothetical protein GW17_00011929 [Ensete ventricosum]|nr:hypothetical protein GW17_00011929 [Ensete ventricosum]